MLVRSRTFNSSLRLGVCCNLVIMKGFVYKPLSMALSLLLFSILKQQQSNFELTEKFVLIKKFLRSFQRLINQGKLLKAY